MKVQSMTIQAQPITFFKTKALAKELAGGCTQTSKMPCESYSLPTEACITGARMALVEGSICSHCYANKGNYKLYANTIKPAQNKRLESIASPDWVGAMIKQIGIKAQYFRWHDSGDIQSLNHLEKIAQIALEMPTTQFWLPTREYAIVKAFTEAHSIPRNLTVRLSAMFIDQPVIIPASLKGLVGASNVHANKPAHGEACIAPSQNGECRDCRKCWDKELTISYHAH